ncbi:cohesin domain-containing protein [Candidatus Bathyarchaeota archaeon]|nr:cohesin domain-containing protein [Candidatus Bathyarchaeota archaeon]
MTQPQLKTAKTILIILIATLLTLCLIQTAFPQSSSNTKVAINPATTNALLGETITINITLSNVQNLYGLDVTLLWNTTALKIQNVNLRLGVKSYPDGVLHEAPNAEIYVQENTADQELGEYHLVATSVAPAPSFSGTGNIATITFNVTETGHTELILTTELADYNPSGSNLIDHTDENGSVDSVIPEFPSATAISLLLILVITTAVVSKRLLRKPQNTTTSTQQSTSCARATRENGKLEKTKHSKQ